MTDNAVSQPSSLSNEDVINELTKDIGSIAVKQIEDEKCKQENSVTGIQSQNEVHEETFESSLGSPEDEKEMSEEDDDSVDEIYLKDLEDTLSDNEKEARKNEAVKKKDQGNELFKSGDYLGALKIYTEGLVTCPLSFKKERAIIFCNRAAAKMKMGRSKSAIEDCNKAIDLDPTYLRAIIRRAVLKEELDQLDEALADWKLVLDLHPDHTEAIVATKRLPPLIAERNEKLKEEMMGKLKSLGNMILRPFGLSTENFQMMPNEDGGYSVQFQQNK